MFANPTARVPDEDRSYTYSFGIALSDVEPFIDALRESGK